MPRDIAVLDACVLHAAPLRDLLLRLALADLYRPRWTDEIHEEWMRSVLERRPDLTLAQLQRTRVLMDAAVPDGLISGYAERAQNPRLPDPADEHVLAAALYCGAESIVTYNLADFPVAVLKPLGLTALHPDDFLCDMFHSSPLASLEALDAQLRALTNPPRSLPELLDTFRGLDLERTVAELETVLRR